MKRIVPGLLIAGFWLLLLLKGSIELYCLIIGLVVLVATDEYVKMADSRKTVLPERLILNFLLAVPVLVICFSPHLKTLPFGVLCSFAGLTCYFLYRYKDIEDSYGLYCRLVFGVLYIGMLGSHVVLLRFLPDGGSWLIIASAITAGSDSGAYFAGKSMGRRKLCPNISPNKTVEGAVGGILAGLTAAVCFAFLLLPSVNWAFLIGAAILMTIVGIAGDLTESIIKRGTGTKDSGTCLAGHGGILDRVDSLLFVCPVLYYFLVFSVV
jgi:phosphatidate cytidylyltransferase